MRGVRLVNDRTARGERRGGVAARGGKGEGKIARAKDRHRPQRDEHPAQVGFGERLPLGLRVVDTRVHPRALPHHPREHTELVRRPRPLALKPGLGKTRFGSGAPDERVAERPYARGNPL